MATQKGTPRDIATQGLFSPDGIGIATQGFIEPILGDIILGGEAFIQFLPSSIIGSGGLVFGGATILRRTFKHPSAGIYNVINLGDNVTNNENNVVVSIGLADSGGITLGGSALVSTNQTGQPGYVGSGGITFGGGALIEVSGAPTVGGELVLGGSASVVRSFVQSSQGGITLGGQADAAYVQPYTATGGITLGGNGQITVTFKPQPSGGLTISGGAGFAGNAVVFGRGGARSTRRVPRLPNTQFEFPVFNPDDYLQPMDYLKKIQDVLDQAEKDKLNLFKYLSKGTVQITGKGKVTAVYRDQPDGEMYVANNPPLEPIILDLPSVFNTGATAIEIAELEDHLFLNDLFGLGDYKIKKGNKVRYVPQKKKTTGGAAGVSFVSGAGTVKHINAKVRRRQHEDDELLFNPEGRRFKSRQQREEEELRLLGLID